MNAELRHQLAKVEAELDTLVGLVPNPLVRGLVKSFAKHLLQLHRSTIEELEKNGR